MTHRMKKKSLILKTKLGIPPKSLIKREKNRLTNYKAWIKNPCDHKSEIDIRLSLLCLQHLGYTQDVDAKSMIQSGCKVWHHYFLSDWWAGTGVQLGHTDKTRMKDVTWHEEFINGAVIGSLASRLTQCQKVSSWVDSRLRHEYAGDDFDYERPVIYKMIAELFCKTPMKGIDREIKRMKKKGGDRTLALYEVVQAISRKDQAAFNASMAQSLKLFRPRTGRSSTATDWIAKEETVLLRLAKSNRLSMPELHEKLEALIVTAESVGLTS